MKKNLVCLVMIFSLLLAAGCSNDLTVEEPVDEGSTPYQPANTGPAQTGTEETSPTDTGPVITEPDETKPEVVDPTETEPEKPEVTEPVTGVPEILINELRTENNSNRAEFIEFKVKKAGNLKGITLYITCNAKNTYTFPLPAIEVHEGEYITYHLRTLESDCVDELGNDLSLSGGIDASPTARDLWVPDSKEWLHKTDIVYLQDADGNILDAVIMNETSTTDWDKNKAHFEETAAFLFNKGAWKSTEGELPGYLDAVDTSDIKTAATKSVSRYEGRDDTNTKNDWYVTAASGNTPGMPNK